jgi:cbb3-type cytochrome oxidase subunit 3
MKPEIALGLIYTLFRILVLVGILFYAYVEIKKSRRK